MTQNLYKRLEALERAHFAEIQASANQAEAQSFMKEFRKAMRERGHSTNRRRIPNGRFSALRGNQPAGAGRNFSEGLQMKAIGKSGRDFPRHSRAEEERRSF